MNETARWEALLRRWSEILLREDEVREAAGAEAVAAGWLGYAGATEAELVQLEERLGCRLPPSYRAFLSLSNGWREHGLYGRLFGAADVAWFREANAEWVEIWESEDTGPEPTDEEYFVYGEEQDSVCLRSRYLRSALQVSEDFDGHVYLLNPEVVSEDGEWEAWSFATWYPGAYRFRSFTEMIEAVLEEADEPEEAAHSNARYQDRKPLETAHDLALSGRAAQAVDALRALLSDSFRAEAAAMLAELQAFRGEWADVLQFGCRSLGDTQEWNGTGHATGPMMLRLVQRAARETNAWEELARLAGENVKKLERLDFRLGLSENQELADYAARRGEGAYGLGYRIRHFDPAEQYSTQEGARQRYERFLEDLLSRAPSAKASEADWARTCFNYAVTFGVAEEFGLLWQRHKQHYGLHEAVLVAREQLREGGEPEAAWSLIQPLLGEPCYPFLLGKVAPIVLLADADLCKLMTAVRCTQVLSAVRHLRVSAPG